MRDSKKVVPMPALVELVAEYRRQGKRVVHCHGVFDLLHIGHIRYFRQAAAIGDVLVVTLSPDQFVDKGPHRPAFNQALRAEAIASQDAVSHVAVNLWPTAEETLRALRPDVYVKGSDFKSVKSDPTGKLQREADVCTELGIELRLTQDIVFSSTNLINRFLSSFDEDVQKYLDVFRSRYSVADIEWVLEQMSKLTVTVVGDAILDDYQFCSPLGASSKEPVLVFRHEGGDLFAGGSLAVANHLANFAGQVHLHTVLGEQDSNEEFIRASLRENVVPHFAFQANAPTIRKRRYVEGYTMAKLLEIYFFDGSGLDEKRDAAFCQAVAAQAAQTDLTVAADFGHGTISPDCLRRLEKTPFLTVNTQANAGNRGFHTITCYERCDFISLAEPEIRLDARGNASSVPVLAEHVQRRSVATMVAVTRGKKGSFVLTADGVRVLVPAFVDKIVDRIGSGDAFFSIASLAAKLGGQPDLLAFLGNVAGSIAVGVVGNKKAIDRPTLMKHVTSLLK